jgi:hypothetical protein
MYVPEAPTSIEIILEILIFSDKTENVYFPFPVP